MDTGVDLDQVLSEFHHFRFTVGEAIGTADDLSVRNQLERTACLPDEDFAELQADVPAGSTPEEPGSYPYELALESRPSACRPHLVRQTPPLERFGEQHEQDYQRGIPPIREVREDWNSERWLA
jgi:hypothetical protein